MRKAFAILPAVLLVASAALALDGQPSSLPDRNHPEFGVADPTIYTLYAWDFVQADGQMTFGVTSPGSFLRYCASSVAPYAPLGYLEGAVHLPTGALVDKIELAACDTDDAVDATAVLYYVPDPGSPSVVLGTSTTAGTNGCFYNSSPTIGHTVNNSSNSYAVEVALPAGNTNVSLRSVRIYYRLQVSSPGGPPTFNDVPASHPFFQFIEALAASGITGGCGNGNYCPDAPLTRGQMAVFLSKALGLYWPY
jgi:S-layer family protein